MNESQHSMINEIELALVAGIAKDQPKGPEFYFRAKAAGLDRYLTDPDAIAAWKAFDDSTGKLDQFLFMEQNLPAASRLGAMDLRVESFHGYNLENWMRAIIDKWKASKLNELFAKANHLPLQEILDALHAVLDEIDGATPIRNDSSALEDSIADISALLRRERPASEIGWFIKWMDQYFKPLNRHELVIIGSRPGGGKTSLMGQLAHEMALGGLRVLFLSLEMSRAELIHRLTAGWLNFPTSRLEIASTEEGERYKETFVQIAEDESITIRDDIFNLEQITSEISMAAKMKKVDVVVIDYLQLIDSTRQPGATRTEQISGITRKLKQLSMTHRVPIICGSQLNRMSATEDRPPRLSDLRESGSIEQDADRVLLLHQTAHGQKMIQAKCRNGPVKVLDIKFNRELTRFEEAR